MASSSLFAIVILLTTLLLYFEVDAFTNSMLPAVSSKQSPTVGSSVTRSTTSLGIGNLFGGGKQETSPEGTTVLDVKAKAIKVGGLRFFLNIYLVGQCNTPEQGTWLVRQDDDGNLDLYFKDGTGMLSVSMSEVEIKAARFGQKPSLKYMLNESIMLHGFLDELNALAFEVEDIEEEKRLIRLNDPGDAIEIAREKLPAKPAT